MTGSRRGHGSTNSGRAASALLTGSPRRFALLALGLFASLALLAATLGAASASAWECYSGNPSCASQGPLQRLVTPGGTSGAYYMSKTTTSFVYWQPKGAPAFPKGYETAVTDFFKGLETENGSDQNFFSVLAQYGLHETHFGKAIKDKDPYPLKAPAAICRWNRRSPGHASRGPRSKLRSKNLSADASCPSSSTHPGRSKSPTSSSSCCRPASRCATTSTSDHTALTRRRLLSQTVLRLPRVHL